jgi:AcrR family transcriptional regulator
VSDAPNNKRTKIDHAAIEQAAAERVNLHGLASLTMSELASDLDVKAPSLYAHVTGIDEVKRMLALRGLAAMENFLARAALGKTTTDALRAMLFGYRDFVHDNPGVYEAMIASPPAGDETWLEAAERLQTTQAAVLSGFAFTSEEEVHVLRAVRSLAHGFAALESSGAFRRPIDVDESFGWLVDVFLSGLQPKIHSKASKATSSGTRRARGRSASASARKAGRL